MPALFKMKWIDTKTNSYFLTKKQESVTQQTHRHTSKINFHILPFEQDATIDKPKQDKKRRSGSKHLMGATL